MEALLEKGLPYIVQTFDFRLSERDRWMQGQRNADQASTP